MEQIKRGDVEILVHTAAPSTGKDDARYRAQAQAYLDFKPITDQNPQIRTANSTSYIWSQLPSQVSEEAALSTQEERESRASYRPSDEDGNYGTSAARASFRSTILEDTSEILHFVDSPEVSFNSVLDNIDSPDFKWEVTRPTTRSQEQSTQVPLASSWEAPLSVISDSQSEQLNLKPAASPARVLEQYMQGIRESESRVLNRAETQQSIARNQNGQVMVSSNSDILLINLTSFTELPSSPSPDKSATAGRNLHVGDIARNTTSQYAFAISSKPTKESEEKSPPLLASTGPTSNSLSSLSQTKVPPRRYQTQIPISSLVNAPVPIASSNFENTSEPTNAIATPSLENSSARWDNIYEIRPRPPPTSTMSLMPEMLITPDLHKLATRMNLAIRFRPVSQSRELRPMERGYWDVDCKCMETDLRRRCWSYVASFISRDMAGWGVWAVRSAGDGQDLDQGQGEDEKQWQDQGLERKQKEMKIRVYCWGVVVGHVYLLLYLASEGRIKGVGARWIGGDGKAIILMQVL